MNHDSLIAPLDLIRFALAYVILILAPGYALAALARPRAIRIERLAIAIPCAYSLVAVYGLATALLHVPFSLAMYVALALALVLGGVFTARRRHGPVESGGERQYWWLMPAGAALAQLMATVLIYAPYVVPVSGDSVTHTVWTNLIWHTHTFPIALLSAQTGSQGGGFYPPVFHALTSLVLDVTPMAAYRANFFSVVAATALLPLALFCYVRAATGTARLGGLAALASLAFEPLPLFTVAQGLYTFAVSLLFVPALALALRDGLARGDRRALALAAGLGVGLFYTHPTEFVTVALLALAVVPGLLRDRRAWTWAVGYIVIVAAVWAIAASPVIGAVRRTMVNGAQSEILHSHDFVPQVDLHAALTSYVSDVYGRNLGYVLLAMVVVGIVWCLARRRYLGLVAAQAILFALFIDATSYDVLQRLYVLSYPWALWERMAPTHYWVALPLAAIGIEATARGLRRLVGTRSPSFAALVAAPLVLIGLLVPLDVTAGRVAAFTHAHTVLAPADLGALDWLARHAPAGSVVVNDSNLTPRDIYDAPVDAGLWMPALGGPRPLFWRQETGPGALAARNDLVRHLADAPWPPRVTGFIERYHVRYIFYGATVRPGAPRHLSLARLFADPRLRPVYSSAATCRSAGQYEPVTCPGTASYVFALRIID